MLGNNFDEFHFIFAKRNVRPVDKQPIPYLMLRAKLMDDASAKYLVGQLTSATVADRVLQSLGLYEQKIHVLSEMNKTIACSIAKTQRELRYTPVIALEEGM